MIVKTYQKFNSENNFEKQRNFNRLDNILIYALIIINEITILINSVISLEKLEEYKKKDYDSKISRKIKGNSDDKNKTKNNLINKRENKTKYNNIKIRYYKITNLIKFIIINIYFQIKHNIQLELSSFHYSSKITLKIKGKGDKNIFGTGFMHSFFESDYPKEVKINGNKQERTGRMWHFDQDYNFVELIWDTNIKNCRSMFYECSYIIDINFNNFDTSLVTSMNNMFSGCSSLTSLDLSNFDTSLVISMYEMFSGCSSLTSLDLSSFNTSLVTYMSDMFYRCSSLASLYLSNFDTSLVTDMSSMFSYCSSLTSLDLSNFDTSLVTSMYQMFSGCSSLTSLDLSNFDTSLVTSMKDMFYRCSSLTSLYLSNFDTSLVTDMSSMFSYCSSLTSLDLSNFDTSLVTSMNYMFKNCSSLTSLDLSNFKTLELKRLDSMFANCVNLEYINMDNFKEENLYLSEILNRDIFYNVPENVVICIKEINTELKIFPQINNKSCSIIDCSDNWKSKQKKIIADNNKCVEKCDNPPYIYEYNGKCYENCRKGFLHDENGNQMNKCKCELDECLLCPKVALEKGLCTKCNTNYYSKENDPLNLGEYIKCYEKPEEPDDNIYNQCYITCKSCNISGNNLTHNCLECNDNYPIEFRNNNYLNCFENCSYYYYFDEVNNYHCTEDLSCPNGYIKLNEFSKECTLYDIGIIFDNLTINEINITEISKEEEIQYYDNIIKKLEMGFTSYFDTSISDIGKAIYFRAEKMIFTITSLQNQNNDINNNLTKINLGECENLLRKEYNISVNETLYIEKIDIFNEENETPKVKYDVYCKLFGTNLIKLNLTVCTNTKILISIPINISEFPDNLDNLDIYNSNSGYYNDICYTTTSEDGTDITLGDRQSNYIDKGKQICQEDCIFTKYDYTTSQAICSCDVKESSSSVKDLMTIDKMKIALKNFKNIKNFININFLVCYKKLFNIKGLIYNMGFYILSAIVLFHIISIFIFYINQFSGIKMKINDIIFAIKENKELHDNKIIKKKKSKRKLKKNFSIERSDRKKMISSSKINKKILNKKKKHNKNNQSINNINAKIEFNNYNNNNNNSNKIKKVNTTNLKTKTDNGKNKKKSNLTKDKKYKIENILKYNDEEINNLSYDLAINYDKRSYFIYYISLIKTKHNLINAFFNNDYNSTIIKLDLFIIGFAIDYVVNALFYNDKTIHNIYEAKGEYNLIEQIPIIAYSTLIPMILNMPLNLLALSGDAIINFKRNTSKADLMKKEEALKSKLKIKFVLFFIISFIFLFLFWYYISIFCVIYKNTQMHLLKDALSSLGLSLLIPFAIYLLPGFFRIPSLSNHKNKRECLYKFSKLLQ